MMPHLKSQEDDYTAAQKFTYLFQEVSAWQPDCHKGNQAAFNR